MAVKEIVQVWDGKEIIRDNVEFLMEPTKKVKFPLSTNTKEIISDLIDTYQATPCAGVAANQIGYNKNIFIGKKNDLDHNKDFIIHINPKIDKTSNESMQSGPEGCLSIPEKTFIMPRFDKITIRRYDENGRKQVDKLNGFISRLFQHEMEHLQGRLMIGGKIHDEMPLDKAVEKIYDELSNYYSQHNNDLNI